MGAKLKLIGFLLIVCFLGYKPTLHAQIDPLWWEEVQGKSLQALRAGDYQKALRIAENALDYSGRRKDAAQYYYEALNFTAALYEAMGNYSMAIQYVQKAIRFSNTPLGRRYARPEKDRMFLSKLYMQIADWQNAEIQLDSLRVLSGPQLSSHPILYAELSTLLGETYIHQGRFKDAVESFEGAAAILLKQYGAKHLMYADALNRQVYAYMQAQNYEQALYGSEKALKIYQREGRMQAICAFTTSIEKEFLYNLVIFLRDNIVSQSILAT